ncbi:MAG: DUF2182 domain-containing protein [Mesorhizobium sp.]
MSDEDAGFAHLDRAGRMTARLALSPRAGMTLAVGLATGLSFLLVLSLAARQAAVAPLAVGPGAALLAALPLPKLPAPLEGLASLCLGPSPSPAGVTAFLGLWAMWLLMATAMMLPSAAPMLRTYCEIADTAARRAQPAAHPGFLLAGYMATLAAAASVLAAVTIGLSTLVGADLVSPHAGLVGAAALAVGGLYQFSPLKDACLDKCRNPFAVLFSRWSAEPGAIFRLGAEQGLSCLGCCAGLMAATLATGVMNPFWMALIAVFSAVEKQLDSAFPGRLAGAILLVWAASLLVMSV